MKEVPSWQTGVNQVRIHVALGFVKNCLMVLFSPHRIILEMMRTIR